MAFISRALGTSRPAIELCSITADTGSATSVVVAYFRHMNATLAIIRRFGCSESVGALFLSDAGRGVFLDGLRFPLKSDVLADLHASVEAVVAGIAGLLVSGRSTVFIGGKALFFRTAR